MDAIELYRTLLRGAHDFLEGTLADVTPTQFTWDPPGTAFSIEPPPLGPGVDIKSWSQRAKLDLAGMRRYGQAVYAASDEYLASIRPDELSRPMDLSQFGLGKQTVLFVLTAILSNASLHTGEISCLKGQQGAKGYPV